MIETVPEIFRIAVAVAVPVVYYYGRKLSETIKYKLYPFERRVKKIKLPPVLKETPTISEEEIISKKYGDEIIGFYRRMSSVLPQENMITLNNNLKGIKVSKPLSGKLSAKFKKVFRRSYTGGRYEPALNKIYIYEENGRVVISHELMHMASTFHKNGIEYCGLAQNYVGMGITEGVTQMLTKKYFPELFEEDKFEGVYPYETMSAEIIDEIMGGNLLEKFYFTNNMGGLIEELSKYSDPKKVTSFIADLDAIRKLEMNPLIINKKKHLEERVNRATAFLIEAYSKKLELTNDPEKDKKVGDLIKTISGNFEYEHFGLNFPYPVPQEEQIVENEHVM